MADFLYEFKWWKGHPTYKISLVNLYSEFKVCVLPLLQGNNKGHKTTLTQFSCLLNEYEIYHFG